MTFTPPQLVLDALVGQGGHRKAGMGDAEPAFFLGHDKSGSVDGLPLAFAVSHCPSCLDAVADYQLMNLTHGFIASVFIHFCKWDSTDASY